MSTFNLILISLTFVMLVNLVVCQRPAAPSRKDWREIDIGLERANGSGYEASVFLGVEYLSMIKAWEKIKVCIINML